MVFSFLWLTHLQLFSFGTIIEFMSLRGAKRRGNLFYRFEIVSLQHSPLAMTERAKWHKVHVGQVFMDIDNNDRGVII